jgi:hypothetical protein
MKLALLFITLLGGLSLYGAPLSGPVINPANGHFYTLLTSNTWTGAQAEAVALGGNLVTINNASENDWVFDTFSAGQRNLWIGLNDGNFDGVYTWIDGSPVTYLNWDLEISQPDGGQEHWVLMVKDDLGQSLNARKWHDVIDDPALEFDWIGPVFGVVEQVNAPPCSPHGAKATATIVNGSVVDAVMTDSGCGYTNAPLVLIQGGGGSGATATAILINGVVSGINITGGGCCYSTNPPPKIAIASPPFVPTVAIAVSRVNVKQHVVLGRNYVLESSTNLIIWAPTGPPFTADSEEITTEFVVDGGARYFRVRQVP